MTKILMVCLGNICRSPLAHGILDSKLDASLFYVDSAGTANYHVGNPPDPRSIAIANTYGIDISKQKSRQFTVKDFDTFDYIYAMDASNYEDIIRLSRHEEDRNKVQLILDLDCTLSNKNVPDPYYGGITGFENVYHLLEEVCVKLSQKLISK